MPSEDSLGVDHAILLRSRVDVPQADRVIVRRAQQVPVQVRVPRQSVALLLMATETEIRVTLAVRLRLGRMLRIVEDEHFAAGSLRGDDARVLRHVARPVHFALVVDLDLDFNLPADGAKSSKFWKRSNTTLTVA